MTPFTIARAIMRLFPPFALAEGLLQIALNYNEHAGTPFPPSIHPCAVLPSRLLGVPSGAVPSLWDYQVMGSLFLSMILEGIRCC